MLLKKLIKDLPKENNEIKIKGLSTNSKKIKKGFIFFAIKGLKTNGEKFIREAVSNGASAIVCSKNCRYIIDDIPIFKTNNVRLLLSNIASKFYKLKPKNIIAVTGTNGKTSVADLFFQILTLNKIPVASIGTLGIKYKNKTLKGDLTSPSTIELHKALEKIKKSKIENAIVEASSHGLHQKRLHNINFKAAVFTNFSQDHLDYHKSMKSYLNAKLILFKDILGKRKSIISNKHIKEFSVLKKISKKKQNYFIDISSIKKKLKNLIHLNFSEIQLTNLSMAISAAKLCNLSEKKIFKSLHKIKDVNGRLELVKTFPNNVKVFVDFAHTPDALFKAIDTLKNLYSNNISLVFGCGGDRDVKKRPLMANIAKKNCSKIYVTDDNPRNENPDNIRKELVKRINKDYCQNIANRTKAIRTSILSADPNEIILIAGKGHEQKQIYKNKILYGSDKQIVKNLKLNIKKFSSKEKNFKQNHRILKNMNINSKSTNFHGLAIDSRLVKENNLFLTIKGKKNNGNNFIKQALKKGASCVISSRRHKKFRNKIIFVSNENKFLNEFALKKRNNSQAKIIAITGSAGKTSLKNLIKNLLQTFGETSSSPKSYNNHFGVPLSLSHLKLEDKFAVLEVGMSKAGEINRLSRLIKPHIGIITNVGEAHIENFKNLRGIADAKGEIINNIKKNGTIILNRDDKYFNYLSKKAKNKKINIISFGRSKKSDVCLISKKNNQIIIKLNNKIIKLENKNLNIYNILSSLALLSCLKLNINKIIKNFKNYGPSDGRGKIYNIKRYNKRFKLIDESYNANPLSVKNAIENFNSIQKGNFKKYLFLGDMLELGKQSEFLHKDLSKVINNSDIDKVFIKGNKTLNTYKNVIKKKRGNIFQLEEDVDFTLNSIIANDDYLMIKGSNATGLNNISKRIIKGY